MPLTQATHVPLLQYPPGQLVLSGAEAASSQEQRLSLRAQAPLRQGAVGLVVQAVPSGQLVQAPVPLQKPPSQPVPSGLSVAESEHAPLTAEHMPLLHGLGLVAQTEPPGHWLQTPPLMHCPLLPQGVPASSSLPSVQTSLPVVHAVMPDRQVFTLLPQLRPAKHSSQPPVSVQVLFTPQGSPGERMTAAESTHDWVAQTAYPARHGLVLVEQRSPSWQLPPSAMTSTPESTGTLASGVAGPASRAGPASAAPASAGASQEARQNRSAQHWPPEGHVPSGSQA